MENNSAGWLTTFNDLMTLLMVFFVLLFTMSSLDVKKLQGVRNSLQSGLGLLQEGRKVPVLTHGKKESKAGEAKSQEAEKRNDEERVQHGEMTEGEKKKRVQQIRSRLATSEGETGVDVECRPKGLVVRVKNRVLFDTGRAQINEEAFPILSKIAAALSLGYEPIRVEGHTDIRPIDTWEYPSNWELSVARAVNVVKYLIDVGKIAPERLSAVGYGASRPAVPNDTPEHMSRNRRVEIFIVTGRQTHNVE